MYGSRARIGLIVPSSNTVCEPEMARLAPDNVAVYASRILFTPTIEGLKDMKNHVHRSAKELSSEGICQLIAFCCTVGSMIGGAGYDGDLARMIHEASSTVSVTTTTAVKAALSSLNVKRVAMATPYTRQTNEIEKKIMQSMGYEVTDIVGYHDHLEPEALENDMIGRLQPDEAYKLAKAVNGSINEAIFISCTNFRAIEIIDQLEQETGKPVITSNQVTMWHSLRSLGIMDSLEGYGRLFREN
ncbi:maleate cis-trans isomerase [Desulfosarcina ovata subsp. sediminis]|uniref:Maleate cis-trans isomerase n=1 Tax=Desulfosarcina ovata subsp. sediminis TaxID=885957 RepID=A0A5K7ZXT5_9BACT|nr:aspartate/glutamate racemase family protein [Desulfosarcina ovata]BBO85087.1 maleate cis-trans isomerase [Desulfosarcina ovata subsp. sediminis]